LKIFYSIILYLLITSVSALSQDKYQINDFEWLSGCWKYSEGKREITEVWLKPSGGILLGIGQTVINKTETASYEFLKIQDEEGGIYYTALPSGQKETKFLLTELKNNKAAFENPQHDFPQLISYTLSEDSLLQVHIEGLIDGTLKSITYKMLKSDCE
jgi:hypothetical protein